MEEWGDHRNFSGKKLRDAALDISISGRNLRKSEIIVIGAYLQEGIPFRRLLSSAKIFDEAVENAGFLWYSVLVKNTGHICGKGTVQCENTKSGYAGC